MTDNAIGICRRIASQRARDVRVAENLRHARLAAAFPAGLRKMCLSAGAQQHHRQLTSHPLTPLIYPAVDPAAPFLPACFRSSPPCSDQSCLARCPGRCGPCRKAPFARRISTSRTDYVEDMRRKLVSCTRLPLVRWLYANCRIEEKDLVIVGGGVAGYVAAIKAGQSGLKVRGSGCRHVDCAADG